MRISEEALSETLEDILSETDISELAKIIYGEDVTVEQTVGFARVTLESILLECLVENYKEWLVKTHCKLGGVKTKYGKEQSNIERKAVEDKYDEWEEKFIKVFEGCFSENQELLDKLKIKFKNYKFNKKNMVDDYSILFFIFSLYEMMSDKCEKKSQIAREYAKAAYEALKRPSGNHALYIDEKKLMTFTEELIGENYKQIFLKIFLKFIQSLYGSEKLHDIELYLFFERFQRFIIPLNLNIRAACQIFPQEWIYIREHDNAYGKNNKKIYKSVYYEKNKLNKDKDKEFIKVISELQHVVATFPKDAKTIDRKTIDERLEIIKKVFDNVKEFAKYKNSNYADVVSVIIEKYRNIACEDTSLSVNDQMLTEPILLAGCLAYKSFAHAKFQGNVYLNLILHNLTKKLSDEDCLKLNELKDNIEMNVKNHIKEKFMLEVDSENRNLYDNIIEYVNLEKFDFPILKISIESWLITYLARLL